MKSFKDSIVAAWKTEQSPDFAYFDAVEENLGLFWTEGSPYMTQFHALDLSEVVEIACGQGRHSAQIADRVGRLHLVDTSTAALDYARRRFANKTNVLIHLSEDGETLPFLADASVTAVFSYDAMVHFEMLSVARYLQEIARVLVPGGKALLHHSNYGANPTGKFTDNPGWRNFMTEAVFRNLASRAGLTILSYETIAWATSDSDALSLLERA